MEEDKIFSENLREIIITNATTNEVLAIIPNKIGHREAIQAKDINILLNYSDKDKECYMDKYTNKIYLKEDDE